jgi:arylsulfatase A-like enzyme
MKKRPNILIFMTDQQQAQVTLPNHPCRTPNLDRFAQEGIRFTSAYPPMAHCCPARASFMTGLYPSKHGIHNNVLNGQAIGRSLNEGVETFSEKLADAGYDLFYSGKWHVSATENPADRGWTELLVSQGKGSGDGEKPGAAKPQKGERQAGEIRRPGWKPYTLFTTEDYDYTEHYDYPKLRRAKEQLVRLSVSERPWCLFVGLGAPHDPFRGPRRHVEQYMRQPIELPLSYDDDLLDKPGIYRKMRKVWERLPEPEVRQAIAHYWAYCTAVDEMFGELLDTVDAAGLKDETLVLFLSDHGEHCGAHGLFLKGISHFDEGYRVPCIMRWPRGIASPGREVDEFVMLTDIAPTLLELAGAEDLSECHGQSLVPFLRDEQPSAWRDDIYLQCNGVEIYYTQRTVMNKQYKFVYNAADIDELYDLRRDPYEMRNVVDEERMHPIKEAMFARMWEHARKTGDPIFTSYPTAALAEIGPDFRSSRHHTEGVEKTYG